MIDASVTLTKVVIFSKEVKIHGKIHRRRSNVGSPTEQLESCKAFNRVSSLLESLEVLLCEVEAEISYQGGRASGYISVSALNEESKTLAESLLREINQAHPRSPQFSGTITYTQDITPVK